MDQATPEGVVAPVETTEPAASPDGQAPEAVKTAETPQPPEAQEPKGVAKRLKELTEARRAAEAREERLLRVLEGYQGKPSQPVAGNEPEKGMADFGYDEKKYAAYVAQQTAKSASEAARAEFERIQEEREAKARRDVFDARADAFAKTVEDYEDVVAGNWACSKAMAEVIEESADGPAIAYYLAQNPGESLKLSKMSPAKAGMELAKIENQLASERKKASEKSVTKAPPPPPKVDGAGDSPKAKPDDPASDSELSDAEWTRRRNAQIAARNRRS